MTAGRLRPALFWTNAAKIRTGIEELERGEGNPEDELDAYLQRLKAQPESSKPALHFVDTGRED